MVAMSPHACDDRAAVHARIAARAEQGPRARDTLRLFAGLTAQVDGDDAGRDGWRLTLNIRKRPICQHRLRDTLFVWELSEGTDRAVHPADAARQARERRFLARVGRHEMDDVDPSRLPDTIDPPRALLEAERRPGQLEVDDEPATVMQVQSFACGIGGEQQAGGAIREATQRVGPLAGAQPAVQFGDIDTLKCRGKPLKGVAIFSEDDERFIRSADQAAEYRQLAFVERGHAREIENMGEAGALIRRVAQPGRPKERLRFLVLALDEGQTDLGGAFGRCACQ